MEAINLHSLQLLRNLEHLVVFRGKVVKTPIGLFFFSIRKFIFLWRRLYHVDNLKIYDGSNVRRRVYKYIMKIVPFYFAY